VPVWVDVPDALPWLAARTRVHTPAMHTRRALLHDSAAIVRGSAELLVPSRERLWTEWGLLCWRAGRRRKVRLRVITQPAAR
jgi:hypothetical protein